MFYSIFYSNFQWLKSTWSTKLLFLSCPSYIFSRNRNESVWYWFSQDVTIQYDFLLDIQTKWRCGQYYQSNDTLYYWIFSFRLCNVEQGFIVLEEAWLSSSTTNFNDFYKWLWSSLVQIVQFSKNGTCLNFEENFQDSNYEWVTYYVSCSTETIWLRYFG